MYLFSVSVAVYQTSPITTSHAELGRGIRLGKAWLEEGEEFVPVVSESSNDV
jgi:hypothetical protein